MAELVEASVRVASDEELAASTVRWVSTPPSCPCSAVGRRRRRAPRPVIPTAAGMCARATTAMSEGPGAKKLRKLFWAMEATIVTMGRPPGSVPAHPNLVLAVCLTRPGEDPGGTGVRLLASVTAGLAGRLLGRGPGLHPGAPRALPPAGAGARLPLVMDYRSDQLGRQANSAGAVMVDGNFYCPAMPEALVTAGVDLRSGVIDTAAFDERIVARATLAPGAQGGSGQRRLRAIRLSGDKASTPTCLSAAPPEPGRPRQDPGPRPTGRPAQGLHPDSGHHRPRHRGPAPPGPGLRVGGVGAGLRHLPQHHRGHQRLHEGPRPRVLAVAGPTPGPRHRRPEPLRRPAGDGANIRKITAHRKLVADHAQHHVAKRARRRRTSLGDFLSPPA